MPKRFPFLQNLIVACFLFQNLTAIAQNQDITNQKAAIYLNPEYPLEKRVENLVSLLTLDEKISQMQHNAAAIERLGIPQYNWWNECLHGVARNGIATVFHRQLAWRQLLTPI